MTKVDIAKRIALWGGSLSGGHALVTAVAAAAAAAAAEWESVTKSYPTNYVYY